MSTQTEQEKWQELADAIGGEVGIVYQNGDGWISVPSTSPLHNRPFPLSSEFRNATLTALAAAKARTPLELAAPMMAEELLRLMDIIGTEDYSLTEQVLKKAGVIK